MVAIYMSLQGTAINQVSEGVVGVYVLWLLVLENKVV